MLQPKKKVFNVFALILSVFAAFCSLFYLRVYIFSDFSPDFMFGSIFKNLDKVLDTHSSDFIPNLISFSCYCLEVLVSVTLLVTAILYLCGKAKKLLLLPAILFTVSGVIDVGYRLYRYFVSYDMYQGRGYNLLSMILNGTVFSWILPLILLPFVIHAVKRAAKSGRPLGAAGTIIGCFLIAVTLLFAQSPFRSTSNAYEGTLFISEYVKWTSVFLAFGFMGFSLAPVTEKPTVSAWNPKPFDVPPVDAAIPAEPAAQTHPKIVGYNKYTGEPIFEEPANLYGAQTPAPEAPAMPQPKIIGYDPYSGTPIYESPFVEEPVVEEPIVEEPVVNVPVVEEPVVEEPVIEEPVVEEPVVEEPVVEEPVIEEPVVEEPVVEEPVIEEPVIEEPIVEEPAPAEAPAIETPAPAEPMIIGYDPYTGAPVYEQPAAPAQPKIIGYDPYTGAPVYEQPAAPAQPKIVGYDPYTGAPVFEQPAAPAQPKIVGYDPYTGAPIYG